MSTLIEPARSPKRRIAAMTEFDDKRATALARSGAAARNRSVKKRFVDPTTTDRQYDRDDCEFLAAMDAYIRASGRKFPTWTEALGVLRSLGYTRP